MANNSTAAHSRKIDLNHQSIKLEGPEGIRVSALNDVKNGEYFKDYNEFENLYEYFLVGEKKSDDGPCLGTKLPGSNTYTWKTHSEIRKAVLAFGSGIIEKGWKAKDKETFIGIYSTNREEWVITDIACTAYNFVSVPLYDTLGESATKHILNLAEIPVLVCDDFTKVHRLLDHKSEIDSLKLIVVTENEIPDDVTTKAIDVGVELVTFTELSELGKCHLRDATPGRSTDLFTLCFTSGTTGVPKGAMLTHRSQLCSIESMLSMIPKFDHNDRHLSYLPLAHVAERYMMWIHLNAGVQTGFFSGDPRKLMEDAAALKPTFFIAVPRVINRIYDKVIAGANGSNILKRSIFKLAFKRKKSALLNHGKITRDSIWDKLVFKRIQMILGGEVKNMYFGGAPVRGDVLTFTRVVFGVPTLVLYGQTECAASVIVPGDVNIDHVGPPIPAIMIKLVDVPEKDYYAKNDKGEVCLKGSCAFNGYYRNPELTAEAIDEDGWLHSGDIGQWLENGTLRIIDRKKHIFKLAQGEYVAPEKLENVYILCSLIAQIFVYGNSHQDYVIALVVPDQEQLMKRASTNKWKGTFENLCTNENAKAEILQEMTTVGENAKLFGFEKVKSIHLLSEPFSIENGALTPTLKVKRPVIETIYKEQLGNLYNNN